MDITLMNFTGVYKEQDFYKELSHRWIDVSSQDGVNCYCSPESEKELARSIGDCGVSGIHFLDSGNYHYMSKIWMEKVKEPFDLLLFDNHTDLQESAFFGLLSCGSWVREALEQNPFLKRVCIAGPPEKDCREEQWQERVIFVSGEEMTVGKRSRFQSFLEESENPLYISVDKDLLSRDYAATNWDQGTAELDLLEDWIREAAEKRICIGADVCGENAADNGTFHKSESVINTETNRKLLRIFMEILEKQV